MTDINELDEIMSGAEDDSATEQTKEIKTEEVAEQPTAEAEGEPEISEQQDEQSSEEGKVPLAALHEARQREREAKQATEALQQQLATLQGQMQVLMQQRQQPQTPQEPKQAPDFWENPDEYLKHQLDPVQQQIQQQREQFSMTLAIDKHGKETVEGAYQAMGQAMQMGDPTARAAYEAIMASPHPYGALVDWHKAQETQRTIGNDPQKWFEQELEKRLSDPAEQAKFLERIRGTAQGNVGSQPQTSLPKSLAKVPGGTTSEGDMSDSALFSQAMR